MEAEEVEGAGVPAVEAVSLVDGALLLFVATFHWPEFCDEMEGRIDGAGLPGVDICEECC